MYTGSGLFYDDEAGEEIPGSIPKSSTTAPAGLESSAAINLELSFVDSTRPDTNFKDDDSSSSSSSGYDDLSFLDLVYWYFPWARLYIEFEYEQAEFNVRGKVVVYPENSLYIFNSRTPFRLFMVHLVTHKYFSNFIMVCVILNSIMYALADYRFVTVDGELDPQTSWRNSLIDKGDTIFVIIFSIEMVFKLVAMGFLSPHGYWADW